MPLFHRLGSGHDHIDCTDALRHLFRGSSCWIMGAGPSLRSIDVECIRNSCAPVFGVNNAGRGYDGEGWLLKPNLWTTFDPTARFSESLFRDPTILKFVRAGRESDMLANRYEKVYSCPGVFSFDEAPKSREDYISPVTDTVTNASDSFVQAIDIAVKLGFRTLYLIGAEMRIAPSGEQRRLLESLLKQPLLYGRYVEDSGRLTDRLDRMIAVASRVSKVPDSDVRKQLAGMEREQQYCFGEEKPFESVIRTDIHYWNRAQCIRQAIPAARMHGISLVCCTPNSRLDVCCDTVSEVEASDRILKECGDPASECLKGRYTKGTPILKVYTEDVPLSAQSAKSKDKPQTEAAGGCVGCQKRKGLKTAVPDMLVEPIEIKEAL